MTVMELKRKYKDRILKILTSIATTCRTSGFYVDEPTETSADENFRWGLYIHRSQRDQQHQARHPGASTATKADVDITFTIAEAEYWDDPDNRFGVNFMLDIVECGGRILGGHCPYNYTKEVWVDRRNANAVEARFQMMEAPSLDSIVECLKR